jgi:hypothetical protein
MKTLSQSDWREWMFAGTALLAMVLVVGCGSDSDSDSSETAPGESSPAVEQTGTDPTSGDGETGSEKPEESPKEGTSDAKPDEEEKTGTLSGVVSFDGALPAPRRIQATKDPAICGKGEGEVQGVLVKDGKLHGAVVELSVRKKGDWTWTDPKDGYVIRQKNCRFSTPLIVARHEAELTIYNDDAVPHNVNSGLWNVVQSPSNDPIKQAIKFSGTPFMRVTCNIHNWMETWVYVARTPYYAASDADGKFEIKGVPTGKYRATIIHPTLGTQRFSAEIKAGETTTNDFVFESKD